MTIHLAVRRRSSCLAAWAVALLGLTAAEACAQQSGDAATRDYAAAVKFQNLESYDLAIESWQGFLNRYPADPRAARATHYLGVCYYQTNHLDQAQAAFEKVLQAYPGFEMLDATYLYLGVSQYAQAQSGKPDRYATAASTLKTLIDKFPQSKYLPDALYYLGECAYLQGSKAEAIRIYTRLVEGYAEHKLAPEALYALGVAQDELNQTKEAADSYDRFLKSFPQHRLAAEVTMRRGETFFKSGQYAEAAARFAKAAAAPAFDLADYATYRQADALAQMKEYAEAAALYASVPQKHPRSQHASAATMAAGKSYYLAGDYARARGLLEKALATGGRSAVEAAHWAAQCYLKEKQPEKALAVTETTRTKAERGDWAAELAMDRADAMYAIPGRAKESIDAYAAVANQYPNSPLAPQALYLAGFAALEQGESPRALRYAETFLKNHAKHELAPDVTHIAAESNLQLRRFGDAEKQFRRLLADHPEHADAGLWKVRRAAALELDRKYEEAIAALEPALGEIRNPELVAEAQYLVGSSRLELKQYPEAARALEASLEAAPKWRRGDEVLLALANACRQMNELDKARQYAGRLVAEFPQSAVLDQAHYRLGEYASAAGDFAGAEEQYRLVTERWPQSPLTPNALYELGCAQLGRKDAASAEKTLSRLTEEFSTSGLVVQARYARGLARQQLKNYAAALEDLNAFLAASPAEPERSNARYALGLSQLGLEQYNAAADTFQKLLADNPKYAGADNVVYQWAWALLLGGKKDEPQRIFTRLVEEFPASPLVAEAEHHIGEYYYDKKDYRRAAESYYRAMEKAGKTPLGEKAAHKLGWAYYHQDDFDNAEKTFQYEITNFPAGPLTSDARFLRGECLFKQGNYEQSLAIYTSLKGLANEEFQMLAWLHAGQAAAQLKRWEESLHWLEQCTEKFPHSPYLPQAAYEQGWAQQNLGKEDQAKALYEQVIARSNGEVAARAQFMIGELQFADKMHGEAVKSFFKVVYGYSYPQWQAEAAYEAGRCFEVLGKKTQAAKMYQELLEKFPKSDKAGLARERIGELGGKG